MALSAERMAEWMASDLSQLDLPVIQIDGLHIGNDLVLLAQTRRFESSMMADHERDFDGKSEIRQHHAEREYAPKKIKSHLRWLVIQHVAWAAGAMRRC